MAQAVTGVYMFILMQEDLKKGMDFYTTLGLKVVFHVPEKWAELETAGIKIGLCPGQPVEKNRHSGLVFQVTDLRAAYEDLKAKGIVFLNEPSVATHGIMVSCADPSGNMLDLYQPTHDKVRKVLEEAGKLCGDRCRTGMQNDACCKSVTERTGCC